ncbi:PucR family transcriptional regulator, partial [Patulibacter sp. S7RM1-6]
SAVCRDPRGMPRAYREARETARCLAAFVAADDGPRVLAADDLGPARLFVANGDAAAIDRFVTDAVGPLLDGAEGTGDLLRTLQAFFDHGRSVRGSAADLGVHENTIRYRFARIHGLTGLDVAADPNDQLTVQTALLVLRLRGHAALPSFAPSPAQLSGSTPDPTALVGDGRAGGEDRLDGHAPEPRPPRA